MHLEQEERSEVLSKVLGLGIQELQYISTCNRVEFLVVDEQSYDSDRLGLFFSRLKPEWSKADIDWAIGNSSLRTGFEAVEHLFRIASSLDSLVVGEREIITQVRKSFDECYSYGITGDYLRLIMNKTIECAKAIYTHTNIAKNPVSIVSLAYRKLRELNLANDSRVLVVGAGETNTTMCKFLFKHGFKNFTVVNRSFENAEKLAGLVNGKALQLDELQSFSEGFDLLVTCTGSVDPIFTEEVYQQLLMNETGKKSIIDLAIPTDVDSKVIQKYSVNYIEINELKEVSKSNLKARKSEVDKCEKYISNKIGEFDTAFQERKIELAMKEVPLKVKEIRDRAVLEVFSKELEDLDENSREVLDKMLAYMEKKYISVPMKMAKEILLKKS